jgi:hypothetical protein
MWERIFLFWKSYNWVMIFALLLGLVIAGVSFFYIKSFGTTRSTDPAVWGQFGDYFGGVLNPALSFCAFVGLLFTLRGQHSEGMRVEDRHQEQVFDARIFQMLGLLSETIAAIKIGSNVLAGAPEGEREGHRALAHSWEHLRRSLEGIDRQSGVEQILNRTSQALGDWRGRYLTDLIRFFDGLKLMLKYATADSVRAHQTKFALDVIAAQLTICERRLMFYFLLGMYNECPLIESLLNNNFFGATLEDPLFGLEDKLTKEAARKHALVLDRKNPI